MRLFLTFCMLSLVLVAFSPLTATAKGPSGGGGGGSGGKPGNSYSGHNWWYPGYGWRSDYYQPYAVERPILVNPLPEGNFSGLAIKIVNPASNRVTLSYTLNGSTFTIPPGFSQDLREDRSWVIEFGRGANFGQARYGLEPGLYTFTMSSHGWELYHNAPTVSPLAPVNPPTPISPQAAANPMPTP